jgi:excisionase family DNA binding protein
MNDNELLTMKTECIASFFKSIDRMLDGIENLVKNHKPTLGGERYLTDREVSARLKVSRRTLQDYRNEGRIPFIQLGGKVLYRESDIQKVLEAGYREAFK